MITFAMTDEEALAEMRRKLAKGQCGKQDIEMILDRFDAALDTIYQAEAMLDSIEKRGD